MSFPLHWSQWCIQCHSVNVTLTGSSPVPTGRGVLPPAVHIAACRDGRPARQKVPVHHTHRQQEAHDIIHHDSTVALPATGNHATPPAAAPPGPPADHFPFHCVLGSGRGQTPASHSFLSVGGDTSCLTPPSHPHPHLHILRLLPHIPSKPPGITLIGRNPLGR